MSAQSTPYYLYGYQRRYPYAWHGNPGGVPQSRVAAESRGLGIFDMLEAGFQDPAFFPFPAFKHTNLHDASMLHETELSDWPLLRPAGPETLDPNNLAGFLDNLSDNEKTLGLVAIAGVAAWWFWKHKRRRNPARKARYDVYVGRSRSVGFTTKARAQEYANSLRRDGVRARVRKR